MIIPGTHFKTFNITWKTHARVSRGERRLSNKDYPGTSIPQSLTTVNIFISLRLVNCLLTDLYIVQGMQ